VNEYAPDPSLSWAERVLLRVEVGSTAHGTGLPGGEDYDELGVMAEPWDSTIGLSPVKDTIVYRPGKAVGERSDPGDYDLVVYTARKFAGLATKGNPSVLMVLFGPLTATTPMGDALRDLAPAFWSDRARARFLGYSHSQRERMLGIRGGKHTNRPELIAAHGYDTKYAMHMVRLGLQGIEYATTGRLTLPIPEPHGSLLRAIRRGEMPMAEVVAMADANEAELKRLEGSAPPHPDLAAVNDWLLDVHRSTLPTEGP
jgi:hypothetical protein